VPYVFGYGAVEMLEHKRISRSTKLKVCQYLLKTLEPNYLYGVPYGLITALAFLAAEDELAPEILLLGTLALEYGRNHPFRSLDWMDGVRKEALIALADWIAATEEFESEEKQWWAWKLGVKCDSNAHLGKAFASHWLAKKEISAESKLTLCWAWVSDDKQIGTPPVRWRLVDAQQMGDREKVKELMEEAGIDPEEVPLPPVEDLPPQIDEEEDPLRWMMRNPQLYFLIPAYLKRLAVPALVRFGEDIAEVADRLWGSGDYDKDAIDNGIADAIREFHHQLSPEALRRLIVRGIQAGRATVRKTFYALSMEFYGDELLERALEDNAKSIRSWARKRLNS
jgi:hypothetical protein